MKEAEWLECRELQPLLDFSLTTISERKLRLFACGCCRRVWQMMNQAARRIVETAEQHADGLVRRSDLAAAWAYQGAYPGGDVAGIFTALAALRRTSPFDAATAVVRALWEAALESQSESWFRTDPCHTDLFRDVVANPFRQAAINPAWRSWSNNTVQKMAQAIYDGRTFGQLPVLADALEDAGCDNPDILAHCRSGGEHVCGCWALDLLLGKS
jgi:hypothetical protein